jgi:hypothetical protein
MIGAFALERWHPNALQRAWRNLPLETRRRSVLAFQLALGVGLGFLDASLGYGLGTLFALLWLRHLPLLPRVAVEVALVAIWAYPVPAFAIILGAAFAIFHLPRRYRRIVLPLAVVATAVM